MIEEYLDIIINLNKLGVSYNNIAKSLGINPSSLHAYVSYHRDKFPRQVDYRKISDEESEEIFNEYMNDGMTQQDISKKHGVCAKTVNRHIQRQMKINSSLGR